MIDVSSAEVVYLVLSTLSLSLDRLLSWLLAHHQQRRRQQHGAHGIGVPLVLRYPQVVVRLARFESTSTLLCFLQ